MKQMNAMILAAGLGTRLKPWTEKHPKALVPVNGKPMLQRVLEKLAGSGFSPVVVNVHHFASQIMEFLDDYGKSVRPENAGLGKACRPAEVRVSDESELLLDTGGGLLHASALFEDGPVLVHNVDILSDADLNDLMKFHEASGFDVTLLTSGRESSRRLAFDADGMLRGWHNCSTGATRPASYAPSPLCAEEAFSGIYVISPKALDALKEYGEQQAGSPSFPIMDFFLSLPEGLRIGRMYQPALKLIDIGKPATLEEARLGSWYEA